MSDTSAPGATYRLQFSADFRFANAIALVDYLAQLGVTDVYSSPILTSRKGSKHGYDVTDVNQIDPAIGTSQESEQFQAKLVEHGMRLILDVVPNHMAASSENRWWMDVLENGSESVFASYFDIDWHPPSRHLEDKILLPVLGRPFGEVLDRGELRLDFEDGKFFVRYFDSIFPLSPPSYRRMVKHRVEELKAKLSEESPVYQEYSGIIAGLAPLAEARTKDAERRVKFDAIRERLQRLAAGNPDIAAFIGDNISDFNGKPGDVASFCALEHLLGEQHFWLAYWQDPNEGINYRRFFTISDLVGIRDEDPAVFEATHAQIFHLVASGAVRGLRIDHIDGLRDPAGYLNRLQERLIASQPPDAGRPYLLVEKILARKESLPEDWPVCGTTGYDYLNAANGLFVCPSGARKLEKIYADFISRETRFEDVLYQKKKLVMNTLLRVEMRSLGRRLMEIAARDRYARNILRPELTDALVEITACLPIYRTYIRNLEVPEATRLVIEGAIDRARARQPKLSRKCIHFLRDVLTLSNPPHILSDQREERLAFVMRWQQFTGPIIAKGMEDTALYVYYPLLSLNEVGGTPEPSNILLREEFVNFIQERQRHWPDSLNATSTHDTKLSEDVRARLNVLSEITDQWSQEIVKWSKENESHKKIVDGRSVPDANEEYLIYQALLGLWPDDLSQLPAVSERVQRYVIKAIREAMVHTRWTESNQAHEKAVSRFIAQILSPDRNASFVDQVSHFESRLAYAGMINGLGQTLLKIACPGVPDFYQGSELWNRYLVDPDNRQAIDFDVRVQALQNLSAKPSGGCIDGCIKMIRGLVKNWPDGRIKMYLIWRALECRNRYAALFRDGEFVALDVAGNQSHRIMSFFRRLGEQQAIIVFPRWVFSAISESLNEVDGSLSLDAWSEIELVLPRESALQWTNIFTGQPVDAKVVEDKPALSVETLLKDFPVAMLLPSAQMKSS